MSEATLVDVVPPMQNAEIIELNVGGTVTRRSSYSNGRWVFSTHAGASRKLAQDNQGRIFLDRNPNRFRILLDWLRNKDRTFKYRITSDMKEEMEYFGLFANLLHEDGGFTDSCMGKRLLPIERMTLLTIQVDGVEYKHTQYDGCMLRP